MNFVQEKLKYEYKAKDFLDLIIYPKQFTKNKHLVFHVVNSCCNYCRGNIRRFSSIIELYSEDEYVYGRNLEQVLKKFNKDLREPIRKDCFTFIQEVLYEQDYYYYHNSKRKVLLAEYKYLLQRLTRKILKSDGKKSILTNNYFLCDGFSQKYRKELGRSINTHKLSYIFSVLQKHGLFHISYNSKNQRVIRIAPSNPYYMLKVVPEIQEQDIDTATDKLIRELNDKVYMLEEQIKCYKSSKIHKDLNMYHYFINRPKREDYKY